MQAIVCCFFSLKRLSLLDQYLELDCKPPMFFIDHTKAVIQHVLEKSFKELKIENKNQKNRKTQKIVISLCLLRLCLLRVWWFSVFLYRPFCHGAYKLDLSTLFTTFFLWTLLPFILLSQQNIYTLYQSQRIRFNYPRQWSSAKSPFYA